MEKIRPRLSEKVAPDDGEFDRGVILDFEVTVADIEKNPKLRAR